MKYIFLVFVYLVSTNSFAGKGWLALNAASNKHCSQKNPCFLKQKSLEKSVKINFVLNKKGKKLSLKEIKVEGKNVQSFTQLKNFPIHFESEKINLFATDLNSDGYMDLALRGARSVKFGYSYFYWVYNPKSHSFIQTPAQIEGLKVIGKNKLKAHGTEKIYAVGPNFQIIPTK